MTETSSITDQTIAQAINKIVDEGDLNALTFNMIFKTLETQFNTKLEERKVWFSDLRLVTVQAFIKSQVLLIIRKKQEENEKAEREK